MSHQRTQSADLYRENEFVLKQLGFQLRIGTYLFRWCPVKANGSQVHFSVWEVTDSLHKKSQSNFLSSWRNSRERKLYFCFSQWSFDEPKTPDLLWLLIYFENRNYTFSVLFALNFHQGVFRRLFLSIENHIVDEKWLFVENQGFRFLQLIQKPDRTKFMKESYLHQRISIILRNFLRETALNSSITVWFFDAIRLNDS